MKGKGGQGEKKNDKRGGDITIQKKTSTTQVIGRSGPYRIKGQGENGPKGTSKRGPRSPTIKGRGLRQL